MTIPVGGSQQMGGLWSPIHHEGDLSTVGSSQDVAVLGEETRSFTSEGSRAVSPSPSPLIPKNPLGVVPGLPSQDDRKLRTSASFSPQPPATPPSTPQGGPLEPSEEEQAKVVRELRELGMGQSVVRKSHDDFSAISPADLQGE